MCNSIIPTLCSLLFFPIQLELGSCCSCGLTFSQWEPIFPDLHSNHHRDALHLCITVVLKFKCWCVNVECSHQLHWVHIAPLLASIVLPSLLALKTTLQKLSELDYTSLPGAGLSCHPFSIQNASCLYWLSTPPSLLTLKTTVQKLMARARLYVAPKG